MGFLVNFDEILNYHEKGLKSRNLICCIAASVKIVIFFKQSEELCIV